MGRKTTIGSAVFLALGGKRTIFSYMDFLEKRSTKSVTLDRFPLWIRLGHYYEHYCAASLLGLLQQPQ